MTRPLPIRRVCAAEADALAALASATFTETFGHLYPPEDLAEYLGHYTPEAYRQVIEDPHAAVWLAGKEGEAPAGFLVAGTCKLPVESLSPHAGEIRQLYVLSTHQNERLGSRLMDAALAWLERELRVPVYVGVWSENFGAQRFYARYGFVKVGEYGFPVGKTIDHEFILKR